VYELDHPGFAIKDRQGLILLMKALKMGFQVQGFPGPFPVDMFYRCDFLFLWTAAFLVLAPDPRSPRRFLLLPGVDVMITIFGDFCQFSAEKMEFFLLKNQCYDHNFCKN
jgi:hypothetical protein